MRGRKAMIYTIDEIRKRIEPVAKSYDVQRVYIFGSYARGEAAEKSDVDILVEGFKDKRFFAFSGFFADLEEALEKEIDLIHAESFSYNTDELSLKMRERIYADRVKIYEREQIQEPAETDPSEKQSPKMKT